MAIALSTNSLARRQRWLRAAGLLLMLLLFGTAPRVVGQDMARVRETIRTLAAPPMHGRGYVRQGEHRAATYLRARFRALGLQSLAPNYTQGFPLTVNTFPGTLSLQADSHALQPGRDFIAEPASGGGTISGPVTVLDTLIFNDEAAQQRFLQQDLTGHILVLRQREASRLATLPAALALAQHLNQAAARLTLVPARLTASLADYQEKQPRLQVLAAKWPAHVSNVSLRVQATLCPAYPTQNLIGYVPGRVQPDSFLVVTAHYDHLGTMGRRAYFPGANDNASGTAMLLELAAHYAQPANRPAYSVVFIAFGAEEAGLLGSEYFVEHPLVPLARIRFLVNLDLLGTGDEGLTVVNGRVLEPPFRLLTRLNDAGHYVPQLAARGRAANSDHFPFSERGVPAFFFYTRGGITAYHDVYDRAETLPLTAFTGVYGLLIAFLDTLGARATTH